MRLVSMINTELTRNAANTEQKQNSKGEIPCLFHVLIPCLFSVFYYTGLADKKKVCVDEADLI